MTVEYLDDEARKWIRYEDGNYEPVRLDGNLLNKRRGPGIPDWWVVDMPRAWSPERNGYTWQDNHPSGPLTARRDAAALPEILLSRNDQGRIVKRILTVQGRMRDYDYSYDDQDRLTGVRCNGHPCEWYWYDADDRRSMDMMPGEEGAKRHFEYNTDNRLLRAGTATFEHDRFGFRSAMINALGRTEYRYAPDYRLECVILPGGTRIEYQYDGEDMPCAKFVNGRLLEEYCWLDMARPASFHNGGMQHTLLYQNGERLPYALSFDLGFLYLRYDQVGSLISVANDKGAVIKYIEYDSFGNVLKDTNPALRIPLGFAGGLHDPHTGLVRFGWRDYDPDTGRWTAKDPMQPAGQEPHTYDYDLGDPVNISEEELNDKTAFETDSFPRK